MDKKLTTKRGQEAWVKNAIENGLPEVEARCVMQKMATIEREKSASKPRKISKKVALPPLGGGISVITKEKKLPIQKADISIFNDEKIIKVDSSLPLLKIKQTLSTTPTEISQFPLWPEVVRSLPNEIFRSALFNARNRKNPRSMMKSEQVAVIGDGRINYRGEELRQDDETVWLQLVHLARRHVAGQLVEFTAYAFCKDIDWSINSKSYIRLKECLRRMQASSLDVYSKRLERGVSLSMIPFFEYEDNETQKKLPRWRVRIAPELVELFGDNYYTRIEWAQRLQLPDGLATWLHGYFATHQVPYPVKIETIARGAGLTENNKSELRRLVKRALTNLTNCGFLTEFNVYEDLVKVKRAGSSRLGR